MDSGKRLFFSDREGLRREVARLERTHRRLAGARFSRWIRASGPASWRSSRTSASASEARANGWLGEVEGLQVSFDAAMAKLNSLKRAPADGRPQLVDLGMPVFTDHAPLLQPGSGELGYRP
ncbi:hypothetical protein ACFCZ1_34730 [Streptomyces sp. NPDC056224]|uniref:hypothetical protein n=1 Tax=Streptomyces sp. NPDC056224 TaxID=3345750 RepID=UPI0035E31F8C